MEDRKRYHDVRLREAALWERPVTSPLLWGGGGSDEVLADSTPLERGSERSHSLKNLSCRTLNILVAVVGLVATAPLMALIALAVKLSSPGPILYSQPRVGMDRRRGRGRSVEECRRETDRGGRIFRIFKFRTMYEQDTESPQVWAGRDDPRVTPLGKVLRKFRLDELPQLVNVLRGDMNIVGPRPEQPEIFRELRKRVPQYVERQRVLPGITGWAQVNHHYDRSFEDVRRKVEFDLEYLQRRSVMKDLRIMAQTVPVIIFRRGAQ